MIKTARLKNHAKIHCIKTGAPCTVRSIIMQYTHQSLVETAIKKRTHLVIEPYVSAFRLLNGFTEGVPNTMLEIFGQTLVYTDHHDVSTVDVDDQIKEIIDVVLDELPWVTAVLLKKRKDKEAPARNGIVLAGEELCTQIKENGIWYAIDLTMNQDPSFYLDTQYLRTWLFDTMKGKTVLNTFAYTGSLGVSALVAGAKTVTQLDLNKLFLSVAKQSALLNGRRMDRKYYQMGDFWSRIQQYKLSKVLFDCVILDPPVFSETSKGTIDLAKNYDKLINKVRPLIAHDGYLVTVNNALFQSGEDHQAVLEGLCSEYLSIEAILPVPDACIGNADTLLETLPANPAPYAYSTKITVLRVKRKDRAGAS